jgi:glycosyltransferase involved in cell wall biosynthesis
MSAEPLVSVIIPAFNAGDWIGDALASVKRQTWPSLEVIVVDDGSTDDTCSIASAFVDDKTRILRQNKNGAAAARNYGLREANGDLVQFLDADDLLSDDKIELQVAALRSARPNSIASCAWGRFSSDPLTTQFVEESVWRFEDPLDWLVESASGGGMMQPAAWLTPRSVIDRAGHWDETLTLHDDADFFSRVLSHAAANVFVPHAKVFYRDVPKSLSRRRGRKAIESSFSVCRATHRIIASRRDDAAARRAIVTRYAQFIYEFGLVAPDLAGKAMKEIEQLGIEPRNSVGGPWFRRATRSLGFANAARLRSVSARVPRRTQ